MKDVFAARFKKAALILAGSTLALGMPSVAHSQTASSNLSVNATVTANCTVSTSALSFGNVDVGNGTNFDGTGGISVTCTNGTAWTAAADAGTGTGATLLNRRMSAGGNLLNYSLFTDAARTSIWGNGAGSTATIGGTGTGSAQNVTVYGRVGSGQTSAPAGSYSDTVAVTVAY